MKKIIRFCILFAALLAATLLLCACEGGAGGSGTTLYVYNWGEYIADGSEGSADVNELFEQYWYEKTGEKITVNYSTYASNEDMYAKICSGAANYDVIIPSDYMIARLIDEDLVQPLQFDRIPNYSQINESFKNLPYDPENVYSVPYFYGMIGVIYNTEMVDENDENLGSWNLMWSPDYAGEILQYNNSRDAFGVAFYSEGMLDVNSTNPADWQRGLDKLMAQKPVLQGYVMDEIFNKMEGGSAAISSYYVGDYLSMYENNDSLEFYYPKEGTNYYVDAMCIPKSAKHAELANEYINFMLQGDIEIDGEEYNIAVENALMTYYACPNEVVYTDEYYFKYMEDRFTDEEREEGEEGIRNGAIAMLYPDELPTILEAMGMTEEEYYGEELSAEQLALWKKPEVSMYLNLDEEGLNRINILWEKLKIKSDVGTGIYVTCAVIVVVIAAIATYLGVQKKRRAKYYDPAPEKE